jgi:hypothetical protein
MSDVNNGSSSASQVPQSFYFIFTLKGGAREATPSLVGPDAGLNSHTLHPANVTSPAVYMSVARSAVSVCSTLRACAARVLRVCARHVLCLLCASIPLLGRDAAS